MVLSTRLDEFFSRFATYQTGFFKWLISGINFNKMESNYDDIYSNSDSENEMRLIIISTAFGFAGSMLSFIKSFTLVEISISTLFSLYFGIFFLMIGMIVLYRDYNSTENRMLIGAFGLLIILSGIT